MNIWQKFFTRISSGKDIRKHPVIIAAVFLGLLVLGVFLSITMGSVRITISEILSVLFRPDPSSMAYRIITYIRVPRTIAAVLAGSGLSVAGAVLQSVLNNSLASPNVIGVNAGSGLFVILIAALFPSYIMFTPVAAFIGAMLAILLVYFIAKLTGASRMAVVLSGIAVSSFIGAISDTILTIWPDTAINHVHFAVGGFSGVTMDHIGFSLWFIIPALITAFILSYDLNILSLGDETARSLGMKAGLIRFIFLTTAALLAGSVISFAGLLGFIGLIVPHAARFLIGHNNRLVVPFSALLGSVFTLFCDLLARVLFAPYEIPVGIIMSFLGGPFFIYLLFRQRKRRVYG
ncbi:MAG: FecCD family ABC transporter permease [Caldicoprobacterales bacterium]|jgi:iron complex transport system permease protein|nr:iron ABC transporter permease [Clostridiales bacterium]